MSGLERLIGAAGLDIEELQTINDLKNLDKRFYTQVLMY